MSLGLTHSARLPASTVDDVEGTLYKFIPSGTFSCFIRGRLLSIDISIFVPIFIRIASCQ